MNELRFTGIGASDGVGIGTVLLYRTHEANHAEPAAALDESAVEAEKARLQAAKELSLIEIGELVAKTRETLGEDKAVILAGQQSMLNDPAFYPEIERRIGGQLITAERAVQSVVDQFAALFESMPQEYMRERAADVKDVGKRLLGHLRGGEQVRLSDIPDGTILVADDLTPSDTVQLDKDKVRGIVTRIGGKTSHTAILAKSLGIPAVLGIGDAIDSVETGAELILDGAVGQCILHPFTATREAYVAQRQQELEQDRFLRQFLHQPAQTADGYAIEVAANIGSVQEAEGVLASGGEGVGLFRTEFLFMNATSLPTEEEQYRTYSQVVQHLDGRPLVIRTLDIGGDKELQYLPLPKEMNPFLGYRAIRLCLDRHDILLAQLRAVLRASNAGPVKVMFPMISGLDEWRAAKAMLEEAKSQLRAEGVAFDEGIEAGIMVEIPSAALLADAFAKEVDFFSIGTNDLVQYTVAVDRMNEKVAGLYDYFHPSVLRLIQMVIEAAHREGKWAGMCGGMAGDPLAAPLLVALGLDEWSMDMGSVRKVKYTVSRLHREKCLKRLPDWLSLGTPREIRNALEEFVSPAHEKEASL